MVDHSHTHSPFKERTTLAEARARLRDHVEPHGRTETVPLLEADGRSLAEPVTAPRSVPHYTRAAMDGYAVRAADTVGASDRSPQYLREVDGQVGRGEAAQVHTGSELPEGADAVVMVEHVDSAGEELAVLDAVGERENVAPVGEDVESGQDLFEVGHRLRPSDLGVLKSVGLTEIEVYQPPTVTVIPTGEELVQSDPAPGEVIETNGLTVSRLAERWGADTDYRGVVTDDVEALRSAIEDALVHDDDAPAADLIVTTGGSSVGKRDLLPEVVTELGELFVHGVGIKPGHPVGLGLIEGAPTLILPGYPVSCHLNAVQFLRPAIKWAGTLPLEPLPSIRALLDEKIFSEPGIRTFARVQVTEAAGDTPDAGDSADCEFVARAVRSSGAGVLSSISLSDGWVVVPEESEGLDAGERVEVEFWEWLP